MATAPLIKIPSVTSSQIINSNTIPLKSGTLTLTEPLASTSTDAKLFLTITDDSPKTGIDESPDQAFTIPLYPEAFVGSKGGEGQVWRFEMAEKELGYFEVTFPEDVDKNHALQFEQVLVYYGFLKTGLVGDADDFSRSLRETASNLSSKITTKTDNRNASTPPAETPTEFSETTHKVVGGAQNVTAKAAQVTSDLGSVVSGAVYDAGAWLGRTTGLKPSTTASTSSPSTPVEPISMEDKVNTIESGGDKSFMRDTMDQALEAGEVAARGVGAGIVDVGSTLGESASKIAEHDHGEEAKGLVDTTRQTGANLGTVAVDAFTGTSVVWHAGTAGVGATKGAGEREGKETEDEEDQTQKTKVKKSEIMEDVDLSVVEPKPM